MTRALFIFALAGCTSLQPPTAICPAGRGPARGTHSPIILAEGENHPVSIVAAAGTVYFANQGPPLQTSAEGEIVAIDVCSSMQTILARAQARLTALVLDGSTLYWTNAGITDGTGSVCRLALGGAVDCFASGEARPSAIAVENGVVYWTNEGNLASDGTFVAGTGGLRRFDGTASTLASNLDAPRAVAARGGVVTWANQGRGTLVDLDGDGRLQPSFVKDSGSIEHIVDGRREAVAMMQDQPLAIAVDARGTYWINRGQKRGTGALVRDGTAVASGFDFPGALALDGDDVYIVITGAEDETEEGDILRHREGAPDLKLVSKQQLPRAIAVDRHLLHWVDFGTLENPDGQMLVRFKDE